MYGSCISGDSSAPVSVNEQQPNKNQDEQDIDNEEVKEEKVQRCK